MVSSTMLSSDLYFSPPLTPPLLQIFLSFFKTLVGKEIAVELKNDVVMTGTHSVDQYLNVKLLDVRVVQPEKVSATDCSTKFSIEEVSCGTSRSRQSMLIRNYCKTQRKENVWRPPQSESLTLNTRCKQNADLWDLQVPGTSNIIAAVLFLLVLYERLFGLCICSRI
jgi:small nuclear ribonucleoprotein (snRNP)-like protein